MTLDEWLAFEDAHPERTELVGGIVYAMAGASRRHNLLASAFHVTLREAGLRHGCRTYMSDMKLAVLALSEHGYYPDGMVVCEPPVDDRYEVAPCLLLEVLSPSTALVDRRQKTFVYQQIATLQAFVVADCDSPRVEVCRREGTRWVTTTYSSGDVIDLACPKMTIDVDDLYSTVW